MKCVIGVVAFISFSLLCRADSVFYGAWYTTVQLAKGENKDSGGLTMILRGDITSPGTGSATINTVVNVRGTVIAFQGTWQHVSSNVVTVQIGVPSTPPVWRGRINLVNGQCSGTWRLDYAAGRFQATRQ